MKRVLLKERICSFYFEQALKGPKFLGFFFSVDPFSELVRRKQKKKKKKGNFKHNLLCQKWQKFYQVYRPIKSYQ